MSRFVILESPAEYFRSALADAMSKERVAVDVYTEYYLVQLLLQQIDEGYHPDETLGDRFAQAQSAKPVDRLRLLREVGDRALVFCGLWWERQYRPLRPSRAEYHMKLGRMAYRRVGGEPFRELSDKFEGLVDALIRFGTDASLVTARDVLRLYMLWSETHSRHAARVLAERGIMVTRSQSTTPS